MFQKHVVCSVCSLVLASRALLLEHVALNHLDELSKLAHQSQGSHAHILPKNSASLQNNFTYVDKLHDNNTTTSFSDNNHESLETIESPKSQGISYISMDGIIDSCIDLPGRSLQQNKQQQYGGRNFPDNTSITYVTMDAVNNTANRITDTQPPSPTLSPPLSCPGTPSTSRSTPFCSQIPGPLTPSTSNDTVDPSTPDLEGARHVTDESPIFSSQSCPIYSNAAYTTISSHG